MHAGAVRRAPGRFRVRALEHGARATRRLTRFLLYLILKEVFWYELPRTLRGLAVGVRRLYLPSGVMNQVSDTKNRVVKA